MAHRICCLIGMIFTCSLRSARSTATDPRVATLLSYDGGGCATSFMQVRAAQVNIEEESHSDEEVHSTLMDLWDGMDIGEQQMSNLQLEDPQANLREHVGFLPSLLQGARVHMPSWLADLGNMFVPTFATSQPKAQYVQILGLFDTGTNLLEKMIMLNFPNLQAKSFRGSSPFIWKHANVGAESIASAVNRSLPNTSSMSEVVVVAMVRSPISNIVSLRKAPYSVQQCVQRSYHDMGQPCVGAVGDVHGSQDDVLLGSASRSWTNKTFNSTMDVYNSYLRQYRDLKELGLFREVLILSYEDLVLDPGAVMKQLAEATGQELPADLLVMSIKAKNHGAPASRQEAVDKLSKRAYLNEFREDYVGLAVLCKGLNRSLVQDLVEGSFRNPAARIPYTQDCDRLTGSPQMWSVPEESGGDLAMTPWD